MASIFKYLQEKREQALLRFFNLAAEYEVISKHESNKIKNVLKNHLEYQANNYVEVFKLDSWYITHIKDDNIAHELFKWREGYYDNNFGFKFIQSKKEKKIIYIAYEMTYNSSRGYKCEDIYEIIFSFEKYAKENNSNLCIEYESFFENFAEDAFRRYTYEKYTLYIFAHLNMQSQEFTIRSLKFIVDCILYRMNEECVDRIISSLVTPQKEFYVWLRHGILLKDAYDITNRTIANIFVNCLRFALNQQRFTSFYDFFNIDNEITYEGKAGLIIDRYKFLDTLNLQKNLSFLKLPNFYNGIEELINSENCKFFETCSIILDDATKEVYLVCDDREEGYQSIDRLIMHSKVNASDVSEYIYAVAQAFSDINDIPALPFKSGTNLLACLNYHKEKSKVVITNIKNISFEGNDDEVLLDVHKVIMQIIKNFITSKNIKVEEIYQCEFMNIIPPKYAIELIKYLKTGLCDTDNLKEQLANLIPNNLASSIQFIENIADSKEHVRKISFFNNVEKLDNIPSFLQKKKEAIQDFSGSYGKYSSLDELVSSVQKGNRVYLTKQNLISILSNTKGQYIYPVKVIISKEVYNYNLYRIIGVEWSQDKIYKLTDFINKEGINPKHIYKIVLSLLNLYARQEFSIRKADPNLLSMLYVDDNLEVYPVYKYNFGTTEFSCIDNYYNFLLQLLKKVTPFTLPQFSFKDISRKEGKLPFNSNFLKQVQSMSICKKHELWRLKHVLCEECQKSYESGELYNFNKMAYTGKLSTSFNIDKKSGSIIGHQNVNNDYFRSNVECGILNNLYDGLSPLKPKKIVLEHTANGGVSDNMSGILYDKFDFSQVIDIYELKNVNRIKVVLVLIKELLPHILNGSFLCTQPMVYSTMFMHKSYKGKIVIPNIAYMETQVIVSNDYSKKEEYKQKSLNVFYDFLYEYIMQDSYYKSHSDSILEIITRINNHTLTEEFLRQYIDSFDAYCEVHKMQFRSNEVICPACHQEGIAKDISVFYEKEYFGNIGKSKKHFFEGGEANLYEYEPGTVQKLFKSSVNLQLKSKVIGKAIQKQQYFEEFNRTHTDIQFVLIKKLLFAQDGEKIKLKGYTEEYIKDSYKISSFKDRNFVQENNIQKEDIIDILIKVCVGIQFLHSINAFIGDLNGGNIVIKDKVVYFIDIDGMSIDDAKNGTYTPLYIYPPSSENKCIDKKDDWYSLAVQAFYYLTCSHPFRGISQRPGVPHTEIERMTQGKSVLGNHGIKPPSISEGWSFLPKELVDYFRDTFENGKRESMLELLTICKKQYELTSSKTKNALNFPELIRKRECTKALSPDMYIDTNGNLIFEEKEIVSNITFKQVEERGVVVTNEVNKTFVVDFNGKVICYPKIYDDCFIYDIFDGQIFYTFTSDTDHGLKLFCDSMENEKIVTRRIDKSSNYETAMCRVVDHGIIITLDRTTTEYILSYNNIEQIRLPLQAIKPDYNIDILLDLATKNTLVLLGKEEEYNRYMVITPSLKVTNYKAKLEVAKSERCVYKDVLYVSGNGKILRYKIDGTELTSIECNIVTPQSTIMRKDNYFFISNEDGKSYMYQNS